MPCLSRSRSCGFAALILLGACSGKKPEAPAATAAPTTAQAMEQAVMITDAERLVLDSANNMFRAKDYQGALAGYRRAAAIAPTDVAPWFGVYMVAAATKDTVLGKSAVAEMTARGAAPGESDSTALKAHQGVPPTSTIH
jgi:hypothetical protein